MATLPPNLAPDLDALVLAYVDGELSADDARAFEARLAGDPALRAEVEGLRATKALLGKDAAWGQDSRVDAPPPHLLDAILRAEVAARPRAIADAAHKREALQKPTTFTARLLRFLVGGGALVGATAAVLLLVTRSEDQLAPSTATADSATANVADRSDARERTTAANQLAKAEPANAAPSTPEPSPPAESASALADGARDAKPDADSAEGAERDARKDTTLGWRSGEDEAKGKGEALKVRGGAADHGGGGAATGADSLSFGGDKRSAATPPSMEAEKPKAIGRSMDQPKPTDAPAPPPPPPATVAPLQLQQGGAGPSTAETRTPSAPGAAPAKAPAPAAGMAAAADVASDDDGDVAGVAPKTVRERQEEKIAELRAEEVLAEKADKSSARAPARPARKLEVKKDSKSKAKESKEGAKALADDVPAKKLAEMKRDEDLRMTLTTAATELQARHYGSALDLFADAERLDGRQTLGATPLLGQMRALQALKRPGDGAKVGLRLLPRGILQPDMPAALELAAQLAEETGDLRLARQLWTRLTESAAHKKKAEENVRRLDARLAPHLRAAPRAFDAELEAAEAAPAATAPAKDAAAKE